jgi:putative copper export protein
VLADPAHRLGGNERALVISLGPSLPRGAYTVRWRAVSNDGHLISGVLAFAVGTGSPRPFPTLSAGGGPSAAAMLLRLVFLAGVLLAGGAALAGRVLLGPARGPVESAVAGVGFALVAGGGFGLLALEPAAEATRFGRVTESAAIAALVGVAAALASLTIAPLRLVSSALAVAVLAAPTLAGHSVDPRRGGALVALADAVHVVGAALWIGGLALFVLVRGKARTRLRRRLPPLALFALTLLGIGAIPRAIAAFPSLDDVVGTGYGRAVLVKTGLLVAVLAVAWMNRRRLRSAGVWAELALVAGVVGAVAVLTDLSPPVRSRAAVAAEAPPAPPPADAVVLAGQADDVAIGFAASQLGKQVRVRVTALGPDGRGVNGLDVSIAGDNAAPCGPGCYATAVSLPPPPRRVPVSVGRTRLAFALPARWPAPAAPQLVARAARVYRGLRTLVIHERLASSARNVVVTTFRVQAPNRLAYRIAGGPEAVIIGGARWDRVAGRWERSEQQPLSQPEPFWGSDPVRNARLLRAGRLDGHTVLIASFYDPRLPAWFELWIDRRSYRPRALRMTAQAHFMRHSYSDFNAPVRIVPPR